MKKLTNAQIYLITGGTKPIATCDKCSKKFTASEFIKLKDSMGAGVLPKGPWDAWTSAFRYLMCPFECDQCGKWGFVKLDDRETDWTLVKEAVDGKKVLGSVHIK